MPVSKVSKFVLEPVMAANMADLFEKLRVEFASPFDLSQYPLIRVKLYQVQEESASSNMSVVSFVLHHIINDGWSTELLSSELLQLYEAASKKQQCDASILPPLDLQYVDFAIWQRKNLVLSSGRSGESSGDGSENELDRQLRYWKQKLANAPDTLDLPTDHSRPVQPTNEGLLVRKSIPREQVSKLEQLAQSHGATMYQLLLSLFALLLYKYSGQSDIIIGSPIANRNRKELENIIGMFVNTLALRVNLQDGQLTFGQLLDQVAQTAREAQENQDLPFEMLVDHLDLSRDVTRNPLFQVMFALE